MFKDKLYNNWQLVKIFLRDYWSLVLIVVVVLAVLIYLTAFHGEELADVNLL